MKKNHTAVTKIAELAVFTALAFIFSYLENLFPLPVPFPGIKLGLANLVLIILLYRHGFGAAMGVSLVRNLLNAFTFGSLFGLFYSLAGSILSLFAMEFLRRCRKVHFSTVAVSSVGGIVHNMGQFAVAAVIVGPEAIIYYFPFLYFAGLAAGILIGIFGNLCIEKLPLPGTPLQGTSNRS